METMNVSNRATKPAPDANFGRLRLAIISTPRSGNTWVRMQLAALYGLEQISAHLPEEIPWNNLPERCAIQIHWWPVQPFLGRLAVAGVKVVVLARHPLDVLMSWLTMAHYKHQDGRCEGNGACTECGLVGASPTSQAFLDYATGENGRVLLCHSPAWWNRSGVLHARYEDLVADPVAALGQLVEAIGEAPVRPIAEVAEEHAMRQMRTHSEVWRFQCWKGQIGLWRHLLPATVANAIQESVPEAFDVLGYPCNPNEALSPIEAELNWSRLQLEAVRDHLVRACEKQAEAERAARDATARLELVREELRAEREAFEQLRLVPPAPAEAPEGLRLDGPGRLYRPLAMLSRYLQPGRARVSVPSASNADD